MTGHEESERCALPLATNLSELAGTALQVLVGLSLVTIMFGSDSPVPRILPSEGLWRLITGFLFGPTGALIAICPVGKASGAHIGIKRSIETAPI